MTIIILKTGPGAYSLIQCDNCSTIFERLTSIVKNRRGQNHFCCLECKIAYQTHRKRRPYRTSPNDIKYRTDRGKEHKDAFLKKEDEVKKRCMKCGDIYYGAPGGFPKDRDPNKPEPGLCEICSKRDSYGAEDYHEQDHVGLVNG